MTALMDIINDTSTNRLKVWCFSEACRTHDDKALDFWFKHWDGGKSK